jgi:chromosome partitioning protein
MHNGHGLDIIYSLREKLNKIKEDYDIIFIDTGPTLGLLSVTAMIAADTIIIPIQASYFALQGTGDLLKTFQMVKKNLNKDLDLLGVIITMYAKNTNISREAAAEIRESFGQKVFSTVISRRVVLEESPASGKGISTYRPKSDSAQEYRALYKEVIARG